MISTSLRGVVSQQLLPTKQQAGRVAALEVLINTPAVANLIRQGKLDQLETAMQSGGAVGMQTMDTALMDLVKKGRISGIPWHSIRQVDEGFLENVRRVDAPLESAVEPQLDHPPQALPGASRALRLPPGSHGRWCRQSRTN